MLDMLESTGVVGPAQSGGRVRPVLLTDEAEEPQQAEYSDDKVDLSEHERE